VPSGAVERQDGVGALGDVAGDFVEMELHRLGVGEGQRERRPDASGGTNGAEVAIALARLEQGNLSNAKAVGEGVLEFRINWGPGYRVYFGRDGDVLVIPPTGGTKQRQQRDIEAAKSTWTDYKRRRPRPK
jgi:putative addiction module killer protein